MNARRLLGRWLAVGVASAIFGAPVASGAVRGASATVRGAGVGTVPPFEPVVLQRINLPAAVTEASDPIFTDDGHHLLFFSGGQMWIVATNGAGADCLTCGLANEPTLSASEQEGFATEFPDHDRVFFGAAGSTAVLQCSPSLIDCTNRSILPVDESGAEPGSLVPPGGPDLLTALNQGGGSSPKLAPDGEHVVFSNVRTDAAELMVLTTLQRTATGYVLTDPRVLNPAGPTSASDPDTQAWSDSSALFEFKSFADGGAEGTYVQVGGVAAYNPDVWEVNFATGQRTRLTANPDWDEDDAPSPDGRSIVAESDRTMHRVDMLGGLLPVRGFIDAPVIAAAASYYVAGPVDRQCDLQPWLLPAAGDDAGSLLGEPLQPYTGGPVHAANNVTGYPQWSPNGTEIALNTESYVTNRSAPYLLIAHLVARRPTQPLPVVSSEPGSWAPSPESYHGAIGATVAHLVLHGLSSGTATVNYADPLGVLTGIDSVTYHDYSDNGFDFVNGESSVDNVNILTGPIDFTSNLVMTGRVTGSTHTAVDFSGIENIPEKVTGTATATFQGTTVTGPPHVPQPCPASLPRPPRTALTDRVAQSRGRIVLHVHVTAGIYGAGLNEAGIDSRPVIDALIRVGPRHARTDAAGDAAIALPSTTHRRTVLVRETAGDTLTGAVARISLSGRRPAL